MSKFAKRFWTTLSTFAEVWAIIGFIRSIGWEENATVGSLTISPGMAMQLYGGIAVSLLLILIYIQKDFFVAWNIKRLNKQPSNILRNLASSIETEFIQTENDISDSGLPRTGGQQHVDRTQLTLELNRLGVNTPQSLDDNEWYDFLVNILPYAENGMVDRAIRAGMKFQKNR